MILYQKHVLSLLTITVSSLVNLILHYREMNIPDIQNHCNSKHEQHQCDNYDRNYYGSTFV